MCNLLCAILIRKEETMANGKPDMSCARVKTYTAAKIGASERHNERKNTDYGNVNVDPERIPMNVHFKDPEGRSYMDILREKDAAGVATLRGLRQDAKLFDELVLDVNTMYFEEHGGYEYAKEFFAEAYRFACEKYGGDERIISAVMHADEINKAATEELGKAVYHYHLHVIALPVVEKEVLWSKRCKDPALRGTVKEVVNQISHSKKWESRTPMLDEHGQPILRSNGKPKFIPSYSVLQDEFHSHMVEHGFTGFQRGERGSTVEHLSSLQYQIEKDTERLALGEEKIALGEERLEEIEKATKKVTERLQKVQIRYDKDRRAHRMYSELESLGKKGLTGKYSLEPKDYNDLVSMAKEGIASRGEIGRLQDTIFQNQRRISSLYRNVEMLERKLAEITARYEKLIELTRPYLEAVQRFPEKVKMFFEKLLPPREHPHEQETRITKKQNRDDRAR